MQSQRTTEKNLSRSLCRRRSRIESQAPALPGLSPDKHLSDRLRNRLGQLKQHKPRTHHKTPDGSPRFINRLILETSPYLLQHAHNPVNWYPGPTSFRRREDNGTASTPKRRLRDLPLVSRHGIRIIRRLEIATYINQNFVAIKGPRRATGC